MKKYFLIILIIIQTIILNGQITDRKFLIDVSGGYQSHKDNVSFGNSYNEQTINSGKLTLALNYQLNNYLYIGFGIEYVIWQDKQFNSFYSTDQATNTSIIVDYSPTSINSILLPSLNLKLFKNLTDKVSIGLNISNGYGLKYVNNQSISKWQGIYPAGLVEEYSKSENKSLYEFSLDPEIMYFLSDRVGVKMKVVALRFDTIYKTQFLFSSKTNEVLWSVGLIIAIK